MSRVLHGSPPTRDGLGRRVCHFVAYPTRMKLGPLPQGLSSRGCLWYSEDR